MLPSYRRATESSHEQAFHTLLPGRGQTMKSYKAILLLIVAVMVLGNCDAFGQFIWTKDSRNPILSGAGAGAWDNDLNVPFVIFNSDSVRYEMWYTASPPGGNIGFAVSSDGVAWTKDANPVLSRSPGTWDSILVCCPCVLRENGQYKMWYTGTATNSGGTALGTRIGYATSPDGRHWTKYACCKDGCACCKIGNIAPESGEV